jgi:hypothetical protein
VSTSPQVLPSGAAGAINRYLDALDAAMPGVVVGLHVCGSLALGDYAPARSDIDVVTVVADELDARQRSHAAEIHRVVATRVDGPYLTPVQLATRPDAVGPVPFHVDGRFETGPCHEVSPITWSILAERAITVRGRSPRAAGVRADPEAVRVFSVANLGDYWAGWARTVSGLLDDTDGADPVEARMIEWCVLGVLRVAIAARSGRVVSKRRAGEYARERCDERWRDIVTLALESRTGERSEVSVGDLRRACDFVQAVVQAG